MEQAAILIYTAQEKDAAQDILEISLSFEDEGEAIMTTVENLLLQLRFLN